jgi:transketolase
MPELKIIQKEEFDRVAAHVPDQWERLRLFSDMCRLNTLVAVKKAGSGHLGSSFSAMDIVSYLYTEVLNVRHVGVEHPDRDIFFSSKGHDVPGLYAVFHAIGLLPEEKLLRLRRIHGLDGHPDVHIPGVESNTGSLGMGISKGRGMVFAKKRLGRLGRVFVMTGDGELQEGQIWESLQTAAHHKADITVVVDRNRLQTDMPTEEIIAVEDLEKKFAAFGWETRRCDGHDFRSLAKNLKELNGINGRPKVLIAETVKGKGVSFMERISEAASCVGKYVWHSGAPADEPFQNGFDELVARLNNRLATLNISALKLKAIPAETLPKLSITKNYVAAAYGEELVGLAETHPELIVLDGDLSADCKVRGFQEKYPDRFIENGIAEQDMVSVAGGLARQGLLPVCNSFSSFLSARANEQIYNNACEGTKILYAAHFAGMIPAGPGKSHQSVRDIGLFGSIHNMIILQPCNLEEAKQATRFAVEIAKENVMLRMNIGPSPREIALPSNYQLKHGQGVQIREGNDALLIAYGPVMLHETLTAAELAKESNVSFEVVNMPWLNRFDTEWLVRTIGPHTHIYVIEDHMVAGGMGERLLAALVERQLLGSRKFRRIGLDVLPVCGTPSEVLCHHELDGASLMRRIFADQGRKSSETRASKIFDTLEAAQ